MKYQLLAPFGGTPGLAISTILDRFNERGILGARLVLSTGTESLRLAAFAGGEATADGFDHLKATGGLAAELGLTRRLAFAAEALAGGRGENFGAALRWRASASTAVSAGLNWFPGDDTYRFAVTLAFIPPPSKEAGPAVPAPGAAPGTAVAAPTAPRFTDARPHFRLRMHGPASDAGAPSPPAVRAVRGVGGRRRRRSSRARGDERPLRRAEPRGPRRGPAARPGDARRHARAARPRDRRRARDAREGDAAEAARLAEIEKGLVAREQQLDSRQRLIAVRGPPTQQQRQLESLEAQLASRCRS